MEAGYQAWSRRKSDATVQRLRDYLTWPHCIYPQKDGQAELTWVADFDNADYNNSYSIYAVEYCIDM